MSFDSAFFWATLLHPPAMLWQGVLTTLVLGCFAQALGFGLGLGLALMRCARAAPMRVAALVYVWVFRGTPLLVQIVFLYTGLAAAGLVRFSDVSVGGLLIPGNIQAAILALGLHEAAYMAEILRGGMAAVPRDEIEAATALGASPFTVLRLITLPRGIMLALPAIGNQFNAVLKNTTLVSVIGVSEMLLATQTLDAATFRSFELYAVLALYFLAMTSVWSIAVLWLERDSLRKARGSAPGSRWGLRLQTPDWVRKGGGGNGTGVQRAGTPPPFLTQSHGGLGPQVRPAQAPAGPGQSPGLS